jgi:hypothetical protein
MPGWFKTFELVMIILSVLCVAAVLMIVVLHLGFQGECHDMRIC